jgi:hypothetical protein
LTGAIAIGFFYYKRSSGRINLNAPDRIICSSLDRLYRDLGHGVMITQELYTDVGAVIFVFYKTLSFLFCDLSLPLSFPIFSVWLVELVAGFWGLTPKYCFLSVLYDTNQIILLNLKNFEVTKQRIVYSFAG